MQPNPLKFGFLLIILLISGTALFGQSQSKAALEKEREQLLRDIRTTQELLDKTGNNKSALLGKLETLRSQLDRRRQLVTNFKNDIRQREKQISQLADSLETYKEILKVETESYFSTLRRMYRWKKQHPRWMYYLSATSANDLFRKWVYLNQIEAWQESKRKLLDDLVADIEKRKIELEEQRETLNQRLQEEQRNTRAIEGDVREEKQLLSQLRSQEDQLKQKLQQQVRERKSLDRTIARLIEAEREKSDNDASESTTRFEDTPEGKAISGAFSNNKGKLPWPVKRGVVTRRFGKQRHPSLSNITIQNNGIDIATEKDAEVFSLFKGKVVGVVSVPGYQKMVVIQHGEYFSVYSRLQEIWVSRGDQLETGESIGMAHYQQDSKQTLVHLEVWRDKSKLDPTEWIAKNQ